MQWTKTNNQNSSAVKGKSQKSLQQMWLVGEVLMNGAIIVLMIYLLVCSILDIKTKRIPMGILYIGIIVAVIEFLLLIYTGERVWTDFILGVIPGAILFLFARISQGKMGEADGIMFMIAGLFFTLAQVLLLFCIAFFFSFGVCAVLVVIRRIGVKSRIPFIPFILLSTVLVGCM